MKWVIIFIILCLLSGTFSAFINKNKRPGSRQNYKDNKHASSAIDGSWDQVWSSHNGNDDHLKKSSQFKMFNNGFFSMVAWDSLGKFSYAGYGKFELEGNIYKETHLYNDNPKYVGAVDWQKYELLGDTLYTKAFTRVMLADGQDITADFPKIIEKRVRGK